jgi:hypothetical protein
VAVDRDSKKCGTCGLVKPLTEFHQRGSGRQSWCRSCRQGYDAAYHARTRERRLVRKRERIVENVRWMRELKSRPCVDCGIQFHPAAMTFDHLPGQSKVLDIASLVRRGSIGLARHEISKCEVVCANCHAVRTYTRREGAA